MSAPIPDDEFARLVDLTELDFDYSSLQDHLGDLTKLAARIAGTDVSLVNLVDGFAQWSVAKHGLDIQQMPREESVCQYTILEHDSLEIKDLKSDTRFSEKFYVVDDPNLRYYYGVPLMTSKGTSIGALCVLDAQVSELDSERKELLAMVAAQVVRRLEVQRHLQLMQAKVEDMNLSQVELSHDFRGPISGIIGLAQHIKAEAQKGKFQDVVELSTMIEEGGDSLLDLADSIMNQEGRRSEPNEHEFSCETLAQKLNELYRPQARHKNVNLEFVTNQHSEVLFPRKRLLQIVGNLIANSLKFTAAGGTVVVGITVEQVEEIEPSQIRIVVEDSGTGMSAEKAQQILSGKVISEKGTRDEEGYGFGLSLVRHLIEQAEGSLQLSSQEGEGSKFVVLLPLLVRSSRIADDDRTGASALGT